MARYMLGSDLPDALQQPALATFGKDRFTGEHRPAWLDGSDVDGYRRNGPPDFKDDAQWLASTEFPVAGQGDRLQLARNGQKPRTHYLRDPNLGPSDGVLAEEAQRLALLIAKAAGRPAWVLVEGQRVGDITFHRPSTGLPYMWRVATPGGDLY